MPSRPSRREIAEANAYQLRRQQRFRDAADVVTDSLATFEEVESIALFGSVARPMPYEVPRFQPFRRYKIEVLHECWDVDLAVWLTDLGRLREIARARNKAVSKLDDPTKGGIAHHQVDVFLFDFSTRDYVGRLCQFATCPMGKRKMECLVPGCGDVRFLRQHQDFKLYPDALRDAVTLYDRATGERRKASELPQQSLEE